MLGVRGGSHPGRVSGQRGVLPVDVHGSVRDELFANSGECELDVSEKYENIREANVSESETRLV